MTDPLADVIRKAGQRAVIDRSNHVETVAAAVRAAGYKSPEEIKAVLDAEGARCHQDSETAGWLLDDLRLALGIEEAK